MLGKIKGIDKLYNFTIKPIAKLEGKGGRLGIGGMLNSLMGSESYDGYKVETDKHKFYVLIANDSQCCENWGYLSSDDDFTRYIGNELLEVNLTDTALNKEKLKDSGFYGDDCGGIQFVDFVTNQGVFQLAVYNEHNGYYGHGILVAKDDEIILNDTL